MDTNLLGCRKRRANSPPPGESSYKRTTTVTAAYNRNFEQKLVDYDIYLDGYDHSDGQPPATPNNMDEIIQRLAQPRRSLSPPNFPESKFREFKQKDARTSKERPVATYIVPTIDGDVGNAQCVGGDYLFGNLVPRTDGTLAIAKPGHFFGSLPKYLEPEIRDELSEYIIPSTQANLPMLPNFFLEAKGPDTSLAVAIRQACYHGSLGARGIYKLQTYRQKEPTYDNNAYTIISIYYGGALKLYTIHPTAPRPNSKGRPEYIMTSLRSFAMADSLDSFRQGATAYRNARDWAKEQRDEFIRAANERHKPAIMPKREVTSGPTTILEGPETASMPAEAESLHLQPTERATNLSVNTKPLLN
ncbi:hypothetical protein MferCBS31731_000162 [Microsporum ferrugineum]